MPSPPRIRPALPGEKRLLEALQLRASLVWEEYRADLEANPDVVALGPGAIDESRVRVATVDGEVVGFSEWSVGSEEEWELEGLFVEPSHMRKGIGARLIEDLASLAREDTVRRIGVIANPRAVAFYERQGFQAGEEVATRFGAAVRMRLALY